MNARHDGMQGRSRWRRLLSSAIVFLVALIGLSVAVVVLRPEDEPFESNVYGGPISPGTEARVRIDVHLVGDADFPEAIQTTARLVAMDRRLEDKLTALGQCGMQILVAQGWSSGGSDDASMGLSPGFQGAAHKEPGCLGNTVAEATEQVPIKAAYYRYPFDRLTYRVRAETRVILFKADGWPGDTSDWRLATPELHFSAPGWRVTKPKLLDSPVQTVTPRPEEGQLVRRTPRGGIVEVNLTRPPAIRLSVVLILLTLLVAVISITKFETLGDSLQVAIAVSVLLWTSRDALVPGEPKLFVAIDAVFLGLALMVLLSLLALGWRHAGSSRP